MYRWFICSKPTQCTMVLAYQFFKQQYLKILVWFAILENMFAWRLRPPPLSMSAISFEARAIERALLQQMRKYNSNRILMRVTSFELSKQTAPSRRRSNGKNLHWVYKLCTTVLFVEDVRGKQPGSSWSTWTALSTRGAVWCAAGAVGSFLVAEPVFIVCCGPQAVRAQRITKDFRCYAATEITCRTPRS